MKMLLLSFKWFNLEVNQVVYAHGHNFVILFFFFNSNLLFIYLFIYLFILFLAVLGLRFCARAFSSCGKRGPLFIAVRGPLHYRGLSCCGAQAPDAQAQ